MRTLCSRMARKLALCGSGVVSIFGLSSCDFGEFTTTQTATLDGREVVQFLVRGAILTPIETAIDRGIDYVFDRIDGEDEPMP